MAQVDLTAECTLFWTQSGKACEQEFSTVKEAAAYVIDNLPEPDQQTAEIKTAATSYRWLAQIAEIHRRVRSCGHAGGGSAPIPRYGARR